MPIEKVFSYINLDSFLYNIPIEKSEYFLKNKIYLTRTLTNFDYNEQTNH